MYVYTVVQKSLHTPQFILILGIISSLHIFFFTKFIKMYVDFSVPLYKFLLMIFLWTSLWCNHNNCLYKRYFHMLQAHCTCNNATFDS